MARGDEEDGLRIDRWLFAARIFKTRALAVEAIDGGKVHLNGSRAKRSRPVDPGDTIRVRKGPLEFNLVVQGLSQKRLSAAEAATLYAEPEDSVRTREQVIAHLKAAPKPEFREGGRPTKKDRRDLEKLRRKYRS